MYAALQATSLLPAPWNTPLHTAIRAALAYWKISECAVLDPALRGLDPAFFSTTASTLYAGELPPVYTYSRIITLVSSKEHTRHELVPLCILHAPPLPAHMHFVLSQPGKHVPLDFYPMHRVSRVEGACLPAVAETVCLFDAETVMRDFAGARRFHQIELKYAIRCQRKRERGKAALLVHRDAHTRPEAVASPLHLTEQAAILRRPVLELVGHIHSGGSLAEIKAQRAVAFAVGVALQTAANLVAVVGASPLDLLGLAPYHAAGPLARLPLSAFVPPPGVTLVLVDQAIELWRALAHVWFSFHPLSTFVLVDACEVIGVPLSEKCLSLIAVARNAENPYDLRAPLVPLGPFFSRGWSSLLE